jgi:ABC-2 type transport system ATP-binding protein
VSALVRTRELSKRFSWRVRLDGVTFEVNEGNVYGLVGPNGAGKTTTIKALLNVIEPTSGCAELFGVDSRQLRAPQLSQVGYVSENQELPGWMTVDYLLRYLRPFYPTWDDQRASELLSQFDLPRRQTLGSLSRGTRMKAAFVAALAYHPKLLILDEPFSGLDPLVRDELVEQLVDCAEETAILISSHDLAEIETFATHIGYLDRGRLRFSEEMRSLGARFRDVEVTIEHQAPPGSWPGSWLNPDVSASAVRFVESQFDEERTIADARRLFGDGARVAAEAMPLRAIFVALARSSRSHQGAVE